MKKIEIIILVILLCVLCGVVWLRIGAEAEKDDIFTGTSEAFVEASFSYPYINPLLSGGDVQKPIMMVTENRETTDMQAEEVEEDRNYYEEIPLSADLQSVLFEACDRNGIDPAIALALIETESRFQPDAVNSYSGCYGLCQLNPACFPSGLCYAENINYGIDYLGRQVLVYGSYEAGLTAYAVGHDDGSRGYANTVISASDKWRSVLEA